MEIKTFEIQRIPTAPFSDQRPGTSGLRKKTRVFMQPHYLENFVQSVFETLREDNTMDLAQETLVVGGDGRYFNRNAIQTILKMAVANGIGRLLIGRGGLLSTPAMSAVIRRRKALGGLILSASHNPGGPDADFGIKYNIRNGGPAPEPFTERIYQHSLRLDSYRSCAMPDLDLDQEGESEIGHTHVVVFDPLSDYTELMRQLFDFPTLRDFFQNGFRMIFDGMHGITGPYASHIFENGLGAPEGTVIRGKPLEDFGGGHPDPNLIHAASLVERMALPDAPDFAAACDGDGDRNLILGRNLFVSPGDSLAIIAEHAPQCIPGYRHGLAGVARSMPTSTAVDRVAKALGIPCYETPTGWKFFGHLMDTDRCTICGEESFGTGSYHIREKDGLWAVLCWISILAVTRQSVEEVVQTHWERYGRSYFQRHDYEGLDSTQATNMLAALCAKQPSLAGQSMAGSQVILADDFSYRDPVDGTLSEHQGLRFVFANGSRIVCRLSGTGTEGATLRLYFERVETDRLNEPIDTMLAPLIQATAHLLDLPTWCGREKPTIIT